MPAIQTLPARVAAVVADIADHEPMIEFPDHSLAADYSDGDPWVTLADMYTDLAAANNCHAATHALADALAEIIGTPPPLTTGTVVLEWHQEAGEPVHWANTLTVDGETWVLDYTARQFNPALPFPYLATLDQWQHTICTVVAREYGWAGARTRCL